MPPQRKQQNIHCYVGTEAGDRLCSGWNGCLAAPKTDAVVSTFTYGDINIELTETKPEVKQAKIIPGIDIEKDPKVMVKKDSEACWLFVKVEQTGTFVTDKVAYSVMTGTDGWRALTDNPGVYYREVAAATSDTSFDILENNKVTVSINLTKEEIKGINVQPTLTFNSLRCAEGRY